MDLSRAAAIANANVPDGFFVSVESAKEITHGWYFPYLYNGPPAAGSKGMIIDKADGSVHKLGSAFTLERDLAAFDQGFRFGAAYLVVHNVGDLTGAVNELLKVRITEAVPEFAHGVEWRIPKPLTSKDIEARLRAVPAKFGPISVYFSVESLQQMQSTENVRFELQYE